MRKSTYCLVLPRLVRIIGVYNSAFTMVHWSKPVLVPSCFEANLIRSRFTVFCVKIFLQIILVVFLQISCNARSVTRERYLDNTMTDSLTAAVGQRQQSSNICGALLFLHLQFCIYLFFKTAANLTIVKLH